MHQPDFEEQPIEEFISFCAKSFCPECGKPVVQSWTGRHKIFCSDRCRLTYDKRKERRKARDENSNAKSSTGEEPETGNI